MKNNIKFTALLILVIGMLTFSCQTNQATQTGTSQTGQTVDKQTYKSTGVIREIDLAAGKVKIDHEDIPGYMPAMQMNEAVSDISLLKSLKPGDKVEFEIERTGAKVVVTRLNKTGETSTIDGRELYQANCALCHGAGGEGAKKGIPLISGHALHHSEADYIKQVNEGEGRRMPAFKDKLSGEQITAIVKFVREQLQKPVPQNENQQDSRHQHQH